jgi:hypothetical protein
MFGYANIPFIFLLAGLAKQVSLTKSILSASQDILAPHF